MKFTKLEHSGCVIEKDGTKIVCDPVEFETSLPDLDNVVAIVVTHKHGDHLQLERISAILDRNSEAHIFTTEDASMEIPDSEIVKDGDVVTVGGFELKFFGAVYDLLAEDGKFLLVFTNTCYEKTGYQLDGEKEGNYIFWHKWRMEDIVPLLAKAKLKPIFAKMQKGADGSCVIDMEPFVFICEKTK